jgi:hypothetical protein
MGFSGTSKQTHCPEASHLDYCVKKVKKREQKTQQDSEDNRIYRYLKYSSAHNPNGMLPKRMEQAG